MCNLLAQSRPAPVHVGTIVHSEQKHETSLEAVKVNEHLMNQLEYQFALFCFFYFSFGRRRLLVRCRH